MFVATWPVCCNVATVTRLGEAGLYQALDVAAPASHPPSLFYTLTEIPRALFEMTGLVATLPWLSRARRGDGHPVLVLPGFLAGDESTRLLRRYLAGLGYASRPWGLGRNSGRPDLMQHRLKERFLALSDGFGQKLSIVGQSLGGVFGRELAARYPDRVRQLIMLGSPFAAVGEGVSLAVAQRLLQASAGMPLETMRGLLTAPARLDVPATAIYSRGDGVVNWRACLERAEDHRTQNIEVIGSHCGMAFNPSVYYVIADRLAQPEDGWRRFDCRLPGLSIHPIVNGS